MQKRFTFQWHITDICNFRCKHCYQDDYKSKGLKLNELYKILFQFQQFIKHNKIPKAHINLTGGEPFLSDDFIELIKKIKETEMFSFGILSNGYLPSKEVLYSACKKTFTYLI